jgi:hypothetical protein
VVWTELTHQLHGFTRDPVHVDDLIMVIGSRTLGDVPYRSNDAIPSATLAKMSARELERLPLPPGCRPRNERDRRMCTLYVMGYSLAEIGALYHLTPKSVGDVLRLSHLRARDRGRRSPEEKPKP